MGDIEESSFRQCCTITLAAFARQSIIRRTRARLEISSNPRGRKLDISKCDMVLGAEGWDVGNAHRGQPKSQSPIPNKFPRKFLPVALGVDANVGNIMEPLSRDVQHLPCLEQDLGYQRLQTKCRGEKPRVLAKQPEGVTHEGLPANETQPRRKGIRYRQAKKIGPWWIS